MGVFFIFIFACPKLNTTPKKKIHLQQKPWSRKTKLWERERVSKRRRPTTNKWSCFLFYTVPKRVSILICNFFHLFGLFPFFNECMLLINTLTVISVPFYYYYYYYYYYLSIWPITSCFFLVATWNLIVFKEERGDTTLL